MPALICDGWTAFSGDGFMSLALHLIPPDWTDIVVVSLGVLPLAPPHDVCHIAEAIQKGLCLLGWDGEGKATVTTDSTAVMPAVVRNLNFEWQACTCHVLHNAALKGNQTLEEDPTGQWIFEFVITFAIVLRQSSTRAELFKKYQLDVIHKKVQASCGEDDNVDNDDENDDKNDVQGVSLAFQHAQAGGFSKPPIRPLKTVKPVKTHWWSWYKALGHIYQLQKAVKLHTADINAGIDPL